MLLPLIVAVLPAVHPQDTVPARSPLAEAIAGHIEVLSSDAFEGRGPGQGGEQPVLDYLTEVFQAYGLEPGAEGDTWLQLVPTIELTPQAPPTSAIMVGDTPVELLMQRDVMLWSPLMRGQGEFGAIDVDASEVVFVGHGTVAPEYGWNDYEGIDVTGKTVVALVNDPGFRSGDGDLFRGSAMTYYGRWTYKFEEAERQGAAACLLIHEEDAAGYGWTVVAQSWGRGQLQLTTDLSASPTQIQGWIQRGTAARVFEAAGLDLGAQIEAAAKPGFRAVPLRGTTFTGALVNSVARGGSYNVVARVTGSKRPDEAVLVMAHWDHLGRREGDGSEDTIFNGAVDNASGTAALLELAGLVASQDAPPERTVLFVVTTAEEQGLLGSRLYASEPVMPLHKTVCGLNIDVANVLGPMEDIVVVGYGASELDDDLRALAAVQGRRVVPEPTPEKGFYFRSDHFSLAKVGVPMLYTNPGTTSREHGAEWVARMNREYTRRRYHAVSDEYDPTWNLEGAAEDVRLFHGLVRLWASDPRWRRWSPGSEFRAAREASLQEEARSK